LANFPDGSLPVAFNATVVSAIQDRTLQRVFRDALFPRLLYRMEALAELWPVNLGANQTFTRAGLIAPSTRPLNPNSDPTTASYDIEQWEATAQQWGKTIDTHMPTSYVTLASQYLRNLHQLGMNSGQSLNRVVRDKLFNAYTAGNTVVNGTTGAGTTIPVINLNGFTRKLFNGRPTTVSAANPLTIIVRDSTGAQIYAGSVTGFTSTIPGDEIHGGTLTVSPAHTGVTNRDSVLATNRSRLIYSGTNANQSVDFVGATDTFALADIRAAVAQLRFDNVPPHEDGSYHVHLDPISESQIFGDNEFQRLNQSIPDYIHYRRFAAAYLLNCTFYRNTEAPTSATVSENTSDGFTTGFEMTNPTSIALHRPIFTGMGAVEEKYLDESRYISEAGIQGKIGEFAVVNGGVQVMTERIRLILRAPTDRLQQVTAATWSYSGDWPIPTDATALSSPAAFKRSCVVVHGSP
jgi:hypothetical protein